MAKKLKLGTDLINAVKEIILETSYPIGSIYMSVNSTNPSTLIGGTWEKIEGRFLLGSNSTYAAGSTGGAASTKLTYKNLPGGLVGGGTNNKSWAVAAWNNFSSYAYVLTTLDDSHNDQTKGVHTQPFNNMPPYLSVYMWKRTA